MTQQKVDVSSNYPEDAWCLGTDDTRRVDLKTMSQQILWMGQ